MSDCTELQERYDELSVAYEEMVAKLEEAKAAPLKEGIVTEGPWIRNVNGKEIYFFRVGGAEGDMVVPSFLTEEENKSVVKGETLVLASSHGVMFIMPEEMRRTEKPRDFKQVSWDSIGGMDENIAKIRAIVEFQLKKSDLSEKYGIRGSKGLLLYGPPGCGKTMIGRAIATAVVQHAGHTDGNFQFIKGPEVLSTYVGVSEARIRQVFSNARDHMAKTGEPAVIFIDEADALLPHRTRTNDSAAFMSSTIVPQFLSEMDGVDSIHTPFVILSTNYHNSLDAAIVRPGRIDTKIHIPRPNRKSTEEIFRIHLKDKPVDDIDNAILDASKELFESAVGDNISGAMIETVTNMAANRAMMRAITNGGNPKKHKITSADLIASVKEMQPA